MPLVRRWRVAGKRATDLNLNNDTQLGVLAVRLFLFIPFERTIVA